MLACRSRNRSRSRSRSSLYDPRLQLPHPTVNAPTTYGYRLACRNRSSQLCSPGLALHVPGQGQGQGQGQWSGSGSGSRSGPGSGSGSGLGSGSGSGFGRECAHRLGVGHGTRARSRRATSRADVRDGRDVSSRIVGGAGMIGQLRPPAEMAMMASSLGLGRAPVGSLGLLPGEPWTGNPRRVARTRRVSALLGECMPFWVATSDCAKLSVPACWAGS